MESLKIVIGKNKDVANQAKDLLLELGLYVSSEKRHNFYGWVARVGSGDYINDISVFNKDKAKLVTIQELRDMVVLKRNDPKYATHYHMYGTNKFPYLFALNKWYFFSRDKWSESTHNEDFYSRLKPIKGEVMKEYLFKYNDQYTLVELSKEDAELNPEQYIEIPEGAMLAFISQDTGMEGQVVFAKGDDKDVLVKDCRDLDWDESSWDGMKELLDYGFDIVWQREKESTIQEKIDYIDELRAIGESGWSKEKHSHYKKDVSHLNVIDPYRIADLYALHPCAEHIMKKSLCAGNRGHKDTLRDIQDIIDTAERWKQMIEEDNNEI